VGGSGVSCDIYPIATTCAGSHRVASRSSTNGHLREVLTWLAIAKTLASEVAIVVEHASELATDPVRTEERVYVVIMVICVDVCHLSFAKIQKFEISALRQREAE
jgi:hypothetical protein